MAGAGKGTPKRCSREGWKARYSRYKANNTRERNKAKRIVKRAEASNNPRKVAIDQAKTCSSPGYATQNVLFFVKKLLDKKGL